MIWIFSLTATVIAGWQLRNLCSEWHFWKTNSCQKLEDTLMTFSPSCTTCWFFGKSSFCALKGSNLVSYWRETNLVVHKGREEANLKKKKFLFEERERKKWSLKEALCEVKVVHLSLFLYACVDSTEEYRGQILSVSLSLSLSCALSLLFPRHCTFYCLSLSKALSIFRALPRSRLPSERG